MLSLPWFLSCLVAAVVGALIVQLHQCRRARGEQQQIEDNEGSPPRSSTSHHEESPPSQFDFSSLPPFRQSNAFSSPLPRPRATGGARGRELDSPESPWDMPSPCGTHVKKVYPKSMRQSTIQNQLQRRRNELATELMGSD